jgi:pimeloyl-ACP methyl ester carboxylesterase
MVYDQVLPLLGRHVRAVAFDTPGYGGSDGPAGPEPMSAYGRQLLHAVDAMGIDGFVPVGMKTGSHVAIELALAAGPARVQRAVLYGLKEFDAVQAEDWANNWASPIDHKADGSHLVALWDKYVGIYGTGSPRDLTASIGEIVLRPDDYGSIYPAAFRHDGFSGAEELLSRGTKITVFEPENPRMTLSQAVEFDHLEGTEVVSFPVTGHLATRLPERFTDEVLRAVGV